MDIKKLIKLRTCEECGSKENVALHHENRDHQDNRSENLKLLCNPCHAKEHFIDTGVIGKQDYVITLVAYFRPFRIGKRISQGFKMLSEYYKGN